MATRRYSEEQRRELLLERLNSDIPFIVSHALKEDLGQTVDFKQDITGQLYNLLHKLKRVLLHGKKVFLWTKMVRRSF